MKLLRTVLLLAVALSCLAVPGYADDEPELSAQAGILVDADSGAVLWERNADERRLIASTTKIMTALIALERCDPDMTVVIDPAWTGIEGSSMYLAPGQELTVRELLYGLMLASGNDAAVALACVSAGSVEAFADLMNERAAALGCENTHFTNPNGLDDDDHYSCARDLAAIAAAAIQNDALCEIASCETITIGGRTFTNHNRLLRECEGVFGVKTGYTEAAGRTLVTCCERGGVTLICVTLSDPDDWRDHAALYDRGFAACRETVLVPAGTVWAVPVIGGAAETVTVTSPSALSVRLTPGRNAAVDVRLPAFVYAPVAEGETAGEVVAFTDGGAAASVPLLYDADVEAVSAPEPTIWERLCAVFGGGRGRIYALT